MAEPSTRARRLPWILVGVAVGFSLWTLRAELFDVWFLNDAGIHRSMVGWAAQRIRDGHLPFDGWYPYLSLGASRFHHYQSLPHILTGTASTVLGGGTFRWSLYLLLCTWPIAVYCGGRLFDLEPWAAGVAALVSPADRERPGARVRMVELRVARLGHVGPALGDVGVAVRVGTLVACGLEGPDDRARGVRARASTICLHLLIGYLAMLSLGVWVLLAPSDFWRRTGRAALVGDRRPRDLRLDAGPAPHRREVDDAGRVLARHVLLRLVRRPACPGVAGHGTHLRQPPVPRGQRARPDRPRGVRVAVPSHRDRPRVPAVGLLSLLLFFGRPTLGFVIDLLPGATDLFLRRYVTGVHLAGIYLAGIGGAWVGDAGDARGSHARGVDQAGVRRRSARGRADRRDRAGGGRALLVRADRCRVDLGAARRPVDGGRRLRVARRDGQGDRSRADLRRHAREQGGTEDPVRPRVRRPAEPRCRCRRVHPPDVVADVERREPVRRTRPGAGRHVRRALGGPARRT